ncbi:MAG TPA: glycosyltransferase family 4 protein [Candidatus Acidoferrales bacterium]|nr:glycosyltransferase family 4 protein [Candidatus Acidoferrales bacterium]
MKICVNTQTPLLKFKTTGPTSAARIEGRDSPLDLHSLREGVDFEFSPGGVTRMVLPLLTHMLDDGKVSDAHWVSLNPGAPANVSLGGITIHHVNLLQDRRIGYGLAKEMIWRAFHGLGRPSDQELLWEDNFVDYTFYNRLSAERIRRLDAREDFDLFYVHDFQQLPVGRMLQTLKPKLLRWHIPFEESMIPSEWTNFLSTYLNSYDAIVVSCRKYLDALKSWGHKGESFYVYPYIDQTPYVNPNQQDLDEVRSRLRLQTSDQVILMVARLDPMKGQDAVIKAAAQVIRDFPDAKLVIVGNGSFSGSKQGLGLSKSAMWLTELRNLVNTLNIENNVLFAGYFPQRLLNAVYSSCDVTVLPSRQEGFGLVVVESWLYKKPTLVSNKAGIAELIDDGKNGILIDPTNPAEMAEKISAVLSDSELARGLGENGYLTSQRCLIEQGLQSEWEIISSLL